MLMFFGRGKTRHEADKDKYRRMIKEEHEEDVTAKTRARENGRMEAFVKRDNTCATCAFCYPESFRAKWEPAGDKKTVFVPAENIHKCNFHDITLEDMTICDVYSYKWTYRWYSEYCRYEDDSVVVVKVF